MATALVAIGALALLESLNILRPLRHWWMPIIMAALGVMVLLNSKGVTRILGWVLAVWGGLLILMVLDVLSIPILEKFLPGVWGVFGLILLM